MWMRVPTNVISSMNATDRGSMSRPAETLNESVAIHSYSSTEATRLVASIPNRTTSTPTDRTPEAAEANTPSQWPQVFADLPATSSTAALSSGMAIINQDDEIRSTDVLPLVL